MKHYTIFTLLICAVIVCVGMTITAHKYIVNQTNQTNQANTEGVYDNCNPCRADVLTQDQKDELADLRN